MPLAGDAMPGHHACAEPGGHPTLRNYLMKRIGNPSPP